MDYRGQDLDLRTSRWSASSTEPSGWREATPPAPQPVQPVPAVRPAAQRSGPIWVDETLLACANHAYDVALAYRSAEVRLGHLLLAMTRVEAAAIALEVRGVRVASLRRDSAVAIAGELPATNADANVSPRRSPELEDVLRLAAARASHTGRAANVDDVVQVLGDVGGDLPGAELIVRHFPRLNRDFWGSLGLTRAVSHAGASHLLDATDTERALNAGSVVASTSSAAVDQTLVQRIFERLAETERAFSERLAALESAIARQSSPGQYRSIVHRQPSLGHRKRAAQPAAGRRHCGYRSGPHRSVVVDRAGVWNRAFGARQRHHRALRRNYRGQKCGSPRRPEQ